MRVSESSFGGGLPQTTGNVEVEGEAMIDAASTVSERSLRELPGDDEEPDQSPSPSRLHCEATTPKGPCK